MCNFVKSNGETCKLSPKKERCGKHINKIVENNVEDNIVVMPPQPQVNAPVVAEVDIPVSSVIKPVEFVADELCDVPDMVKSETLQVIEDENVYGEEYSSDSELNNLNVDEDASEVAPEVSKRFKILDRWIRDKEYDERLFDLCANIRVDWFQNKDNIWNFAGFFNRIPNADFHIMVQTYYCIIRSKTGDLCDCMEIKKIFNQWEDPDYKYHPKCNEAYLRQVASGHNLDKYQEWKAKYEPTLPPKEKIKINPDNVDFTDNCLLRIEKIGRLSSVEKEFLLEGIHAVNTMLEEDWLDEYVAITNRPILGYKRTWQEYIRYVQAIKFTSMKKAAALLAMTIDRYIILMGNSFLYRCGLDSDHSNDVLTQAKGNPLEEITLTYWCENKNEYKSVKALRVYEQFKSLFHTYEEYANLWGNVSSTKFSTCVPFKGNQLDSVDEDVIEPFLTFVKEIIANNDDELYMWLIKWIAHIYKYPNSRTRCALILLSLEEGTGKGTFCDILTYLFGVHNMDQSGGSVKSLVSERSSHLVGKKFAMVQEMRENKGEYMGFIEALKSFITDDYIAVRPLYANKMTVKNLVELIITSNNENILKLPPKGRRFTVAKISTARLQDNDYFKALKKHCQTQSFLDNIATYLMKVDVKEGSIKALATSALIEMAEASQDSIASYWSDMKSHTLQAVVKKTITTDESGYIENKYIFTSPTDSDHIQISRSDAYESYKGWCAKNNEVVFKNRKFQSDTAHIGGISEHRTKDNRFWKIAKGDLAQPESE